jgi:uncharacterized protein YbjT (DUF2867 family)
MVRTEAGRSQRPDGVPAAVTLTEPGHEGATYTLTGPAAITHAQIAAALGDALGREMRRSGAARRLRPYLPDGGGGELGILRLGGIHRRR